MRNIRVRLFTLLQVLATVMMLAMLALPVSTHASDRKASKPNRKASPQLVERNKRSANESLASRKNGNAKSSKLAAGKPRKADRTAAKTLQAKAKPNRLSKGEARAVKRLALASKKGSKKPVARLAPDDRAEAARRSQIAHAGRVEKRAVRLVAHRPSAPLVTAMMVEPRGSLGEQREPHSLGERLEFNSSVALVLDQQTNEVLFRKNDSAVLPIASLTKLMTGLVVTDAGLSLDDLVTITSDDIDTIKGSRSRLAVGTTLTRRELMHLALMSSENRAAHALGRNHPGGLDQFVREMNAKARELGMRDTRYVDPTGLSSLNQSSARDLATLVSVAYERPLLRSLSTSPSHQLELGHRTLEFRNSNILIRNPEWDIGLQKTGYISEAGRCLVMQAQVAGRQLIMVFLDATGKMGRAQDAERVRRWVEAQTFHAPVVRPQG
jgi:D-alanyl-D-alanine endopeptidase (penicillin-binding protein 7)